MGMVADFGSSNLADLTCQGGGIFSLVPPYVGGGKLSTTPTAQRVVHTAKVFTAYK